MSFRRLRRLDLNLLVVLEALLTLKSVTAAAHRLHVSQPSMSGSLARLRQYFGDSLLVPVGRKMELSPLAELLLDPVREALEKVDEAISLRPDFDPATAQRQFQICASDSTVLTLLTNVMRKCERVAPGIGLDLLPVEAANVQDRVHRREIDFSIVTNDLCHPDHPSTLVIDDSFHCMAWSGNRNVKDPFDLEQYLALGHVVARYGIDRRPAFEELTIRRLGVPRRIEVVCSSTALLGQLIVDTQRIATVPTRLGRQQAELLPVILMKPPVEIPNLRLRLQWHRSREGDGAMRWLRDLIGATSHEMGY